MLDFVDNLLNRITMYRLVLYYLVALLGIAILFSFVGVLAYDPYALLFTIGVLVAACSITNWIFARTFAVPANAESTYISALILALIILTLIVVENGVLAGIDLAPIAGKGGLRGYEATERMYHDLNIYVRVAGDTLVVAPPLISTERANVGRRRWRNS